MKVISTNFKKKTSKTTQSVKLKFRQIIKKHPLRLFFGLLGVLLLLIILSNIIQQPKKSSTQSVPPAKSVNVYQIGGVPKIRVQAQIEKSGVIRIVAMTSGVVAAINKQPGEHFDTHETLLELASNYKGGNVPKLQKQLAQTQYNSAATTYKFQKDIIAKQKELASKTDINNDELRKITEQSIADTQGVISLNDDIIRRIDDNIRELEENNPGGIHDAEILAAKQMKSQFLTANNAAKQSLRNAQYQSDPNNPPAQMSDLQRDITIKQLELQEKTLALNVEMARIQVRIAQVQEGIMFPSAPFNGSVQRVFVKVGDVVQPGKELMVVSQDIEADPIIAIAYVSNDIARKVSMYEQSAIHIAGATIYAYPSFISSEAIQGSLYGIYYNIPDNFSQFLTEKGYIQVDLPIGYYDTNSFMPFLPIDAVYQTQDTSYVYVVKNNRAESRIVMLGQVYGSFVEVTNGLEKGDQVILDRTVIAGDKISVSN